MEPIRSYYQALEEQLDRNKFQGKIMTAVVTELKIPRNFTEQEFEDKVWHCYVTLYSDDGKSRESVFKKREDGKYALETIQILYLGFKLGRGI